MYPIPHLGTFILLHAIKKKLVHKPEFDKGLLGCLYTLNMTTIIITPDELNTVRKIN